MKVRRYDRRIRLVQLARRQLEAARRGGNILLAECWQEVLRMFGREEIAHITIGRVWAGEYLEAIAQLGGETGPR